MAFSAAVVLLCSSIPAIAAISLADHVTKSHHNLFPASRGVDLKHYHVEDLDRLPFERTHMPRIVDEEDKASFSSLLRRRDGLKIYGKDIIHGSEEPNYATLSLQPLGNDASTEQRDGSDCGWEATLLLIPDTATSQTGSCFVAMNRFAVKKGCKELFEKRWAERSSKLPEQPGFLSFCLIRQRNGHHNEKRDMDEIILPFNYSSLTLWKSFDAWTNWREGDGRYSHDSSRTLKRTPVSEWLEHPASPVFWDGVGTVMAESGV